MSAGPNQSGLPLEYQNLRVPRGGHSFSPNAQVAYGAFLRGLFQRALAILLLAGFWMTENNIFVLLGLLLMGLGGLVVVLGLVLACQRRASNF